MSEIIAAAASEALNAIASTPGQAAGQSTETWLADQLFKKVVEETTPGYQPPVYNWKMDPALDDAFSKVVDQSGAEGAWQAWKEGGGNVSSGGNAGPSPTVKATPETAIKKAGAGAASAGGLLSMSLPTWVAAAAPVLGVAVGAGLYELSPELWEKISRALLPFCYEDTQVMPVVTDEDGNTYIDKDAVEALKNVFDEEGIGGVTGHISDTDQESYYGHASSVPTASHLIDSFASNAYEELTAYGGVFAKPAGANNIVMVSRSPTAYYTVQLYVNGEPSGSPVYIQVGSQQTITRNGEIYYATPLRSSTNIPLENATTSDTTEIADIVFFGDTTGGVYPDGTSEWEGDRVDFDDLPITKVFTDPADSTKTADFVPVALPTNPGQSLDPEENPDPTTNSDPERQISPYFIPYIPKNQFPDGSELPDIGTIAPIPSPYPNPNPKPDADADPTQPSDTPPGKIVDVLPGFDPGVNLPVPSNPSLPGPSGASGDGGVGGLVSVYNPSYAELTSFSQWLWVTYADATIDKIWNNPFDGIISLHELYATPDKGARKYIKSGFLVSPVDSITIPNRYTEIDCGTAIFPEFYGNYLDYSPYSKALCYLPFIGIVELNVDDIVGHTVNITYHVDSYSGACIALINCVNDRSSGVLYQFSGNCSVQMPIAGGSQAAIKAAQISAGAYQNAYHIAGLAGLAGGVASGIGSLLSLNLGGALSGTVNGIGSYMSNQAQGQAAAVSQTVSAKSSVQHSGQFGESFGAMGNKKPYMILKRPVQVQVPNYQSEYGYPAHKYVNISECTGYIRCRGVHVLSARATDSEKHMIEQALTEGVYVT